MNIIKLLPVSFLPGQISCLIECLIGFVADHSNTKKQSFLYRTFHVTHPKTLHKMCTSRINYERDKLGA